MEHIRFWTSDECPALSREDIELIQKLAGVVGIRLAAQTQLKIVHD